MSLAESLKHATEEAPETLDSVFGTKDFLDVKERLKSAGFSIRTENYEEQREPHIAGAKDFKALTVHTRTSDYFMITGYQGIWPGEKLHLTVGRSDLRETPGGVITEFPAGDMKEALDDLKVWLNQKFPDRAAVIFPKTDNGPKFTA